MDSSNSYSRDCGWRWKHHGHRPLFIYLFIFLPEWCLSLQWCSHVCTNRVRVQWSPTVASSRPEMTSGMTPEMTSGMTSDPVTVGSLLFVVEFLIKKVLWSDVPEQVWEGDDEEYDDESKGSHGVNPELHSSICGTRRSTSSQGEHKTFLLWSPWSIMIKPHFICRYDDDDTHIYIQSYVFTLYLYSRIYIYIFTNIFIYSIYTLHIEDLCLQLWIIISFSSNIENPITILTDFT